MKNLAKELPNHISKLSSIAVKELQILLNKNGYSLIIDGICGEKTITAFNQFKEKYKLTNKNEIGKMTLDYLIKYSTNQILTVEQLKQIYSLTPVEKIKLFIEPINQTLIKFNITNKSRICAFLAQAGHESSGLKYTEELASGNAYEFRKDLGNIYRGDGMRFKGHGIFQITGRDNHTKVSQYFGEDFISNPRKLCEPFWASLSAGWYWHTRGLNLIADYHNLNSFRQITKKINGGYNGLEDRLNYWSRAKSIINC